MPSRTAYIRRKDPDTRIAKDLYPESTRRIGASLSPSGDINRALTLDREKHLLPDLIGISANDPGFARAVKNYYAELTIAVPLGGEGVKFEIGEDEHGNPINVADYVKYHFAIKNPQVKTSKEEANQDQRALYYIYDPAAELKANVQDLEWRLKASEEFLKVVKNPQKVDHLLTLYGEVQLSVMSAETKVLKLEEHKDGKHQPKDDKSNPHEKFFKYATDKNLEMLAFVQKMLTIGALQKIGNAIYDGDEKVGNTMEEAVIFLNDKKNSSLLVRLKAREEAYRS